MAENADIAHAHGHMPIKDHSQTYHGVMGLFKWGALGVADLMILLVMAFCTPAGFFPALVVAGVILAVGVFALRARPPAH